MQAAFLQFIFYRPKVVRLGASRCGGKVGPTRTINSKSGLLSPNLTSHASGSRPLLLSVPLMLRTAVKAASLARVLSEP